MYLASEHILFLEWTTNKIPYPNLTLTLTQTNKPQTPNPNALTQSPVLLNTLYFYISHTITRHTHQAGISS